MSASVLIEAAGRIRRELCYGGSGHEFYAAIADWLEAEATLRPLNARPGSHALTVANAYLGSGDGREGVS